MILHRFLGRRLRSEPALVDDSRGPVIECDHLGSRLAAPDHLECPDFDTSRHGVGNSEGRLTQDAKLGSGPVDFIGVFVPPG